MNKGTMDIIIVVLALGIAALFIVAAIKFSENVNKEVTQEMLDNTINRYIDREAGVVCWIYNHEYSNAQIDCLPIQETRLRE